MSLLRGSADRNNCDHSWCNGPAKSLPSQERGSKPQIGVLRAVSVGRSFTGARIETIISGSIHNASKVAPSQERGSKLHTCVLCMSRTCRSFTGARIETFGMSTAARYSWSLLHRSADRNNQKGVKAAAFQGSLLHRSADRNFLTVRRTTGSLTSLLHRSADRNGSSARR